MSEQGELQSERRESQMTGADAGDQESRSDKEGSRLAAGQTAPDFERPTGTGDIVRFSLLRGQAVVLFFYVSDTRDECIEYAKAFRDRYGEIVEHDALLFGVSKDGHMSHEKMKLEHDLPYALLVDPDCVVAKRYGAWGERTEYGHAIEGVIRSHVVVDEEGVVVHAAYDVEPEESVQGVLDVLADLD